MVSMETPADRARARREAWGRLYGERRRARGLTHRDVAERFKAEGFSLTAATSHGWERGAFPGLDKAGVLCDLLDMTERQLVAAASGSVRNT